MDEFCRGGGLMSWQDIPLKAVNFTSFWLSHKIKTEKINLDDLFWYANNNGYNIAKSVILDILDVMVSLRLVETKVELDKKMTFELNIPKSSDLIAQYKKSQF